MAEKLNLPNKVINSEWKDDVDVDYAIYGDNEKSEREYIPPEEVSKESINMIKRRNQKLGHAAVFLFDSKNKISA